MSENLGGLSGKKGLENNLFEQIVELSKETGTLPDADLKRLSEEYLFGDANLYGTVSFYDFIKKENEGKKVYVCNGSACMLAGTQDELSTELRQHFSADEIGHMCCLGRCHENKAFHFEGKNYSGEQSIEDVIGGKSISEDSYYIGGNSDEHVLIGERWNYDALSRLLESVLSRSQDEILGEIIKSNIRGRGGAGFPMGTKLKFCKSEQSDQKFIVCNADEGDPGAYSDRYLLENQPELVLMGMIIGGYIIGANKGVVYVRAEYPESVQMIKETVTRFREKGLIGRDIFDSGFDFYFKIIEGAGAYICGEETALLSSIEGQRPEVRVRPPYPAQQGLFNKPTIVNNVETLAAVPEIVRKGGDWYAGIGTENSKGSKLICLDSHFKRPGLYEVLMGTPLEDIVYDLGKGFKKEVKALHIGGPLGGIVPMEKVNELTLDFESFQENGFLLGHGSILSIPSNFPMIKYLEHLFEFTAAESCGKCFPCSIGSVRGREMLNKAQSDSTFQIDHKLMNDLLETLEIGSLCALGGGLPLSIKNAMQYFSNELSTYFK